MDPQPPAMMSGSYANVNAHAPPYALAEIWQFPMNGGGEVGQGIPQFGNNRSLNQDGSCDNPTHPGNGGSLGGGVRKRRDVEEEPLKNVSTSNGNSHDNANGMNDCDGKRIKTSAYREDNGTNNTCEAEPGSSKPMEQNKPPPEPLKQDYIHVRARRGQATDSHSLAERARREKISERMKILQDLVPGCNKVIGKALVLDEIINYIQSLQHQVEFLSMKLEALNSRMNPGIDVFPPKEFGQQMYDNAAVAFSSQAPREYSRGSSPEWLHMNIGGSFERTT